MLQKYPQKFGMLMLIIQLSQKQKLILSIGYVDKSIKPLVLIIPKMSGYVKTFKVTDGDKDKNNKLMSLRIGDEKLFVK